MSTIGRPRQSVVLSAAERARLYRVRKAAALRDVATFRDGASCVLTFRDGTFLHRDGERRPIAGAYCSLSPWARGCTLDVIQRSDWAISYSADWPSQAAA